METDLDGLTHLRSAAEQQSELAGGAVGPYFFSSSSSIRRITMQNQKSGTDFIIAIIAMSSIAGVARTYFNIGRPIVKNVVENVVEAAKDVATDASA